MRESKESLHVRKIADYIKRNIGKGYTTESLKWALINQRYSRFEVDKGMELATKEMADQAPKLSQKPIIKYEAMDGDEVIASSPPQVSWWKRLLGLDE